MIRPAWSCERLIRRGKRVAAERQIITIQHPKANNSTLLYLSVRSFCTCKGVQHVLACPAQEQLLLYKNIT